MLRPYALGVDVRVAFMSETTPAQSILTRSKTPKQNQHEHCVTMKHTVGMLLVSLLGCGLEESSEVKCLK